MKLTGDQLTVPDVTNRQPEPPTVYEIVKRYLQDHGHDGLCNPSLECGCGLADLMCCEMSPFGCQPARRTVNEFGEEIFVLDDRPEEAMDGHLCEMHSDLNGFCFICGAKRACREMEESVEDMSRISPPVHGSHATIECACCHQVVDMQ